MISFAENENAAIQLVNLRQIARRSNGIQDSVLYHHSELGYILVINGELQHVEAWYFNYHEPLVHLPLAFIKNPRRALILGGGDFFAASEVLKYSAISEVVMYDHDADVVEMMIEAYPHARAAMRDPRFRLVIGDASDSIDERSGHYDLIINDCFDLINGFPGSDRNIHDEIYISLTDDGLCSDLVYRNIFDHKTTTAALKKISSYESAAASLVYAPEYPGCMHVLTVWGKNKALRRSPLTIANDEQKLWTSRSAITKYYSPDKLAYHLYIPPYIRNRFPILQNKPFFEA